jgi:hypothetical protein
MLNAQCTFKHAHTSAQLSCSTHLLRFSSCITLSRSDRARPTALPVPADSFSPTPPSELLAPVEQQVAQGQPCQLLATTA